VIIYHSAHKVASMHISYVRHIDYAFRHLKWTFFHQHKLLHTTHIYNKRFLMQIPVFIQFLSSFYNYHYYSIIWNTNQRTTISYLVSVKRRLLPKILFFHAIVRLRGDDLVKSAETYSSIYIVLC